jgi:uncharacterized protein (DUF342 family)
MAENLFYNHIGPTLGRLLMQFDSEINSSEKRLEKIKDLLAEFDQLKPYAFGKKYNLNAEDLAIDMMTFHNEVFWEKY